MHIGLKKILWLIITLSLMTSQSIVADQTDNLLANPNFQDGVSDWTLSNSDVKFDTQNYGSLNDSVRYRKNTGGDISQVVIPDLDADQQITQVDISFKALGCNNPLEGGGWCTVTGTDDNMDYVKWDITFQDDIENQVISFTQQSDYNEGVKTFSLSSELSIPVPVPDLSQINVNVFGLDSGHYYSSLGSWHGIIIDNLELTLTTEDIPIVETPNIDTTEIDFTDITANTATVEILSNPVETMTVSIDTGIDMELDMEIEIDMVDLTDMVDIGTEEIGGIDEIPEIEDIAEIDEIEDIAEIEEIEEIEEVAEVEEVEEVAEIETVEEPAQVASTSTTVKAPVQKQEVAKPVVKKTAPAPVVKKVAKVEKKREIKKAAKKTTAKKKIAKVKKLTPVSKATPKSKVKKISRKSATPQPVLPELTSVDIVMLELVELKDTVDFQDSVFLEDTVNYEDTEYERFINAQSTDFYSSISDTHDRWSVSVLRAAARATSATRKAVPKFVFTRH